VGKKSGVSRTTFPTDKTDKRNPLLFLQAHHAEAPQAAQARRAGVIVPNGTLFGDGVCARIKEENC